MIVVDLTTAAEMTLVSEGIETCALDGGQSLFSVGQEARHMYFIMRGDISYKFLNTDGSVSLALETVLSMVWLSEQALWLASWQHKGVASARQGKATGTEALSIAAAVFQRAFSHSHAVKHYARRYLEVMQEHTDVSNVESMPDIFFADEGRGLFQSECSSHSDLAEEPSTMPQRLTQGPIRSVASLRCEQSV